MRYSQDQSVQEVLRRRDLLAAKKQNRTVHALSAAALTLTAFLIIFIVQIGIPGKNGMESSVYGSFLLSAETGGYVLTCVIAFVLGVIVTVLCLKRRGNKTSAPETHSTEKEEVTL